MEKTESMTYWEQRTVNIGEYESIKSGLSYTSNLKRINEKEQTLDISHSDSESIDEEKEAFIQTAKRLQNRVKAVLNARETDLRIRTARFTDTMSEEKIVALNLMDAIKMKKKKKAFQVEMKAIDEMDTNNDEFEV